ncbi:MAG: hypothetical protein QOH65_181 [Methylobacteriaceae bacterium]|jgi:predicted protein tyrosine phosphatase|nr:hypothetical protein [Methylobacteriaceae bacterium]
MPRLHVCSLARVAETVRATGARSLVTLINVDTLVSRPAEIDAARHLFIGMSDIIEPLEGHILPGEEHVKKLIAFAKAWDRGEPLVIHCHAGVSRSTAAAFIIACALAPSRRESEIAEAVRRASHTATPNPRMVAIADAMLKRGGRMVAAIERIGRGSDCYEGIPFVLELI